MSQRRRRGGRCLAPGEGGEPESVFFRRWATLVLRHRVAMVALVAGLTGLLGWEIVDDLRTNMTIESFLQSDSDALDTLEAYRDQFGRDDMFLVIVEGDVFSMPYLQRLRALHEELSKLDLELESLGERIADRQAPVEAAPATDAARAATPADGAAAAAEDDSFGDFGDDAGGEAGDLAVDDWADEAGGTIVDEITSLINFRRTRGTQVLTDTGEEAVGIDVGELLDPFPTADQLESLRAEVMGDSTLVGQVVDPTARFSAIAIRTQFMAEHDSHRVNDAIIEIARRHRAEGFTTWVSGMPSLAASLNRTMMSEIQRLFVLAISAVFLMMLLIFKHPLGVVGPLVVVALSNLWTFGTMALLGLPVTMLSNVLPAFIVCVGIGDSIHIQSVYRDLRRRGVANREAIIRSVATTGTPVLFTTLTTMFGLLSFQLATIDAVAEMGLAGAIGVAFALLHSLVVLPVMLTLNRHSLLGARPTERGLDLIDRFLDGCAALSGRRFTATRGVGVNHRRRRGTLAVGLGLTAVAIFGASTLTVWHDPLSWVPDEDPTKQAFRVMDEDMGGAANIQLLIESTSERGMKDVALLRGLEQLEAHIREYRDPRVDFELIGNAVSLLDIVRETNRALHGGDQAHYRIPDTQEEVDGTLFLFESSGPSQLRRMASADLSTSQMAIRVRWLEATSYGPLTEHVQVGIDQHLPGLAQVRTTGAAFTLFTTVSSLIYNLLRSFSVAFLVITLFMMLLLRDVKLGLISMVPNLIPVLYIMGLMGFVGIPIDMNNLLIASIAIGLAVDDTIHFLHRWKVHYDHHGDVEEAIAHAFQHSGRAMVGTTAILSVGFFVYVAATLANLQRFGMLIGLTIIFALLVDIVFGPALIRTLFRSRTPVASPTDEDTGVPNGSIGSPSPA